MATEAEAATRAEYQVELEVARAALEAMRRKRDDPATSEAMRALYQAQIQRLGAQIKEIEDALEDYLSPAKFAAREAARERWVGKQLMNAIRQGGQNAGPASTWLDGVKELAGEEGWLFEEPELEADGYEQFTTPGGEEAWRKKPNSAS